MSEQAPSKPTSILDLEVILKDFMKDLELEPHEGYVVIKQKGYMDRKPWLKLYTLVKDIGGRYVAGARIFEVPLIEKSAPIKEEKTNVTPITVQMEQEKYRHKEFAPFKGLAQETITVPKEQKITAPIPLIEPKELPEKFGLEDLGASAKVVGQIFPVVKDQFGNILDGFHRKRVDPNWKETTIEVKDPFQALRIRVHANIMRRKVERNEKEQWVSDARKFLKEKGLKGTQREIAEILGLSLGWVSENDPEPTQPHKKSVHTLNTFFGYNVWGFQDDDWRKYIIPNDPNQPDKEFYHGSTPAFVIHQLIQMFQPKSVLDSMAGVGTTGYICKQYDGIECDQFDLYPYPKYNVQQGDAELIDTNKKYDLIFNHIPYLRMVKYGENPNDLSNMSEREYFAKLQRIFKRNYELLKDNGVFAVLVGDWRCEGKLVPLSSNTTMLGLATGFILHDEAIKLTAEQKSTSLQEYRAAKFGYLAQTFDMVLIFRKALK